VWWVASLLTERGPPNSLVGPPSGTLGGLVMRRSFASVALLVAVLGPSRLFRAPVLIILLFSSQLAQAQFTQQGPKLVGTGAVGAPKRASPSHSPPTAIQLSWAGTCCSFSEAILSDKRGPRGPQPGSYRTSAEMHRIGRRKRRLEGGVRGGEHHLKSSTRGATHEAEEEVEGAAGRDSLGRKPLVANRQLWPPKPRRTTPTCPGTRGLDTATITRRTWATSERRPPNAKTNTNRSLDNITCSIFY
jgi:hypothetical protein